VLLVAGVSDRRDIPETFFGNDLTVVSLVEVFGEERALQHTTDCITDAVQEFLRAFTPPVTPASHRQ
jgi:hypothetical protein